MIKKRIIILDDHTLFLRGMTLILKEYCVKCDIYTYQSIQKIKLDKLNLVEFDLLISDIDIPNEDTFNFFITIKEKYPNLPILVVSMHKKHSIIKKCKSLNIEGYILKDEDEQFNNAIETILNGGEYYSKTIIRYCNKTKNIFNELSTREEDIIKLITNGFNNNEIAEKLFLSIETVKTHKKNIRIKLNVNSNSEIIKYSKRNFF